MFSRIDSSATDEGLLAFNQAITLMRKHPRILDPVCKLILACILVAAGLFFCVMFFGRSVDSVTLSICLLAIAAVAIGACVVVELLTTVYLTANVRLAHPREPKDVRLYVKKRLWDSLKVDPLGLLALIGGMLLVGCPGFFLYLFADVALEGPILNSQALSTMLFSDFVSVIVSALASLFTVLTARYVVVHGSTPSIAFGRALAAIREYKNPCIAVVFISMVMGCTQAMFAFLVVANHIECRSLVADVVSIVAAISMFAIMWVVQIVPYIAVTERRKS